MRFVVLVLSVLALAESSAAAPAADPVRSTRRFERRGLFVTWNQMYVRRPGRFAFARLQRLKALLG